MTWVLVIGAGWLLLACVLAVVIGRSVRLADASVAEAGADRPNFVVEPGTAPVKSSLGTVLPFPAPGVEKDQSPAPQPGVRDTPTIPGIPVARPPAPGAGRSGGQVDPIRRTGLG